MISGFFYIRMLAREEPELGSSFDPVVVLSQLKTYFDSVMTPAQVAKPEPARPTPAQVVRPVADLPKAPAPPLGDSVLLSTGSPAAATSSMASPAPPATGGAAKVEAPAVVPGALPQVVASPIPLLPPPQAAMTPAVTATPLLGRAVATPEERVTKGAGLPPSSPVAPVESQRSDITQATPPKEKPLAAGSLTAPGGPATTPVLLQELRAMERSAKPEEIRLVTPPQPPQERPQETRVPPAPTYSIQPRLRPEGYYGGYGYSPGYYGPYGPWQMPAQPGYGQGRGVNQ